jgi:hypothetical protein
MRLSLVSLQDSRTRIGEMAAEAESRHGRVLAAPVVEIIGSPVNNRILAVSPGVFDGCVHGYRSGRAKTSAPKLMSIIGTSTPRKSGR